MEQKSTTTTYVQNQKDEFRSLIKALRLAFSLRPLTDATQVFKTKTRDACHHQEACTELLKMQNDDEWSCFYETQAASLEPKRYPTLDTIQNVFALALKRDPEIKNFNPLVLSLSA
jgi:hypothetical protein